MGRFFNKWNYAGLVSLDPSGILLVELLNPNEAHKAVQISIISGNGLGATTIELVLDGNSISTGSLMIVTNSNTALNEKRTTIARISTENIRIKSQSV